MTKSIIILKIQKNQNIKEEKMETFFYKWYLRSVLTTFCMGSFIKIYILYTSYIMQVYYTLNYFIKTLWLYTLCILFDEYL